MTGRRLLAVGWTVSILVALSIPGTDLPDTGGLPIGADKWVHAGLFAGFGWLWARAFPARPWLVAGAGLLFAVATEVWQAALPIGRSGDAADVLADAVGLGLGLAAGLWNQRQRERAATLRDDVPAGSAS